MAKPGRNDRGDDVDVDSNDVDDGADDNDDDGGEERDDDNCVHMCN